MSSSLQRWTEGTSNRQKLKLKQIRAYHAIESLTLCSLDDLFSREPSCVVYVAGAGAAVGITQQQLANEVQKFGPITNVELDLRYPFAIVEMGSIEAAKNLRGALHCTKVESLNDRFVFIEFAQTVVPFENVHSLPLSHPAMLSLNNSSCASHLCSGEGKDVNLVGEGWGSVPPGLFLIPNFVSQSEEALLLQCIEPYPWEIYNCRHVMHFGYEWDYTNSNINLSFPRLPFPQASIPIVQRMRNLPIIVKNRLEALSAREVLPDIVQDAVRVHTSSTKSTSTSCESLSEVSTISSQHTSELKVSDSVAKDEGQTTEFLPNQLTINKYLAGHSIPPHVDTHSACHEMLVSLSLGSFTVMEFAPAPPVRSSKASSTVVTPKTASTPSCLQSTTEIATEMIEASRASKGGRFQIPLPPRSLLVLTGEARYAWTHSIRGRRSDRIDGVFTPRNTRVSWTFRTSLHPQVCQCEFPAVCDDARRAP